MKEKPIISYLKFSSKRVGRLYPVLIDKQGNIIDGMHRLKADKNWPKIKLENVETEEQRLITRLISNVCRRNVPAKEKTETLAKLGEIYQKEGIEPGKIAYKIAEKTGMSYRWVMKYLPNQFKDNVKSDSARAARRAAEDVKRHEEPKEIVELTEPPKEKILTIQKYANTHFVNVVVEKPFYTQLERIAERLRTTPDVLISNILLKALKEIKEKISEKKEEQ
jgi:hypothetical protein